MASPLNVFRKYQKQLLAGLLVTAMITFVIGPALLQYLEKSRQTSTDKVAVSWNDGKFTEANVHYLRENHNLLLIFLEAVQTEAAQSGGSPKVTPIARAHSDDELVMRSIKARKAEKLGLVVTQDAMVNYLRQLSDNTIVAERFNRVMHDATSGRLDERTMFSQLRSELLAQRLESQVFGDFKEISEKWGGGDQPFGVTPAAAWDYFTKMKRRVTTEMYPISVENYVSKVKQEPTPAQITKLYEDHKDEFRDPNSPEPGFKKYNEVAFQYVRADFDRFLAEEKKKVTAEQITEYYEKNKDVSYTQPELPELPDELDKPPADKSDDKPADKSDDKPPADKSDDKPPADKPDDKPPAPKEPQADSPPKDDSSNKPEGCQDEPEEPSKPEKPAKDEAKPAAPKDDEAKSKDEPKTEDNKTDESEKPAEKPAKPKKPEVKYRPLDDKLKEEISRLIALPLARKRMNETLDKVREKVTEYGLEYRSWEDANKREDKSTKNKVPKPDALNVKTLARSLGLQSGEIPLIDPLAILEDAKKEKPTYPLSQAQQFDAVRFIPKSFVSAAFIPGASLFDPTKEFVIGKLGSEQETQYVYWRTQEKPAYVSKLEEARKDVIAAWKQSEAFKLAREAAQKLADEANKSGKSIKENLPEGDASRAFETDAFSWLSRNIAMGGGGEYLTSRIKKKIGDEDAVELPGDEFMNAVFSLKIGECGVAANEPQTQVYVVRVIEEPISEELLRTMFLYLDTAQKSEIFKLAIYDRIQQRRDWDTQLKKEMAIKWQRDPWVARGM